MYEIKPFQNKNSSPERKRPQLGRKQKRQNYFYFIRQFMNTQNPRKKQAEEMKFTAKLKTR
jgi:hypothetical protein